MFTADRGKDWIGVLKNFRIDTSHHKFLVCTLTRYPLNLRLAVVP